MATAMRMVSVIDCDDGASACDVCCVDVAGRGCFYACACAGPPRPRCRVDAFACLGSSLWSALCCFCVVCVCCHRCCWTHCRCRCCHVAFSGCVAVDRLAPPRCRCRNACRVSAFCRLLCRPLYVSPCCSLGALAISVPAYRTCSLVALDCPICFCPCCPSYCLSGLSSCFSPPAVPSRAGHHRQ